MKREAQATLWTLNVRFAEDKCTYAPRSNETKLLILEDVSVFEIWILNFKSLLFIGENGE